MNNPYSYVIQGGVANTRVTSTGEDATLSQLAQAHASPVAIPVPAIKYHNGTKRERSDVKKALPYFVGAVLEPAKRDDKNVQSRTLLTLDIEQDDPAGEQPPAPQEIVDNLRELGGEGWVYTSLSHTPDRPRYRVVLALGKPIEGPLTVMQGALKASTIRAASRLGLEPWCRPESWVLSQAMYLPAKLKGGTFFQEYVPGKAWGTVATSEASKGTQKAPADIPDTTPDPILNALRAAGLYIRPNPKHDGMHFITCPFVDQHEAENDTQTVYYEAHFDGNPRPAVKCFDTAPDVDGEYHLTFAKLVRYLKEGDFLTQDQQSDAGVMDDYDAFVVKANLGRMLDSTPQPREWAIPQFAPVGKVTVLAGPGGVSKSMLMLHVLVHAALGQSWGAFKVDAPLRSLYVSYEDDTQELHSRVHALAGALKNSDDGLLDTLYDVAGSIRKNLLMFAADEEALAWVLASKPDRFGVAERTERVEWLVGLVKHAGIKLLVLDPAVYTHQLEENSVADMAAYMQMLTYIAKRGDCAVVVLHHMSKAASWVTLAEVNQGSLRGASSFADNARSVTVAMSMPPKDAALYGLPSDRATSSKYVVIQHVKHNYSAPMGQQIFERQGPLLIPRPEIVALGDAEVSVMREQQKAEEAETTMRMQAMKVLHHMLDLDDFATVTQIGIGAHVHKRHMKDIIEWAEGLDYIEVEDGAKRARLCRLTKAGRSAIKFERVGAK
jgi:RecA-family ATPase